VTHFLDAWEFHFDLELVFPHEKEERFELRVDGLREYSSQEVLH
jgi:hypothetical protein